MAYTPEQLLEMTQTAARRSLPRQPRRRHSERFGQGHRDHRAGNEVHLPIAEVINHFGWQGKVFDAEKGVLKNRILAFGLEAIVAKVYKAQSWLDDKECIVLDYSEPRWSRTASATRSGTSARASTSARCTWDKDG